MVETRTATSQIEAENIHMLMIMNGEIKTELHQGWQIKYDMATLKWSYELGDRCRDWICIIIQNIGYKNVKLKLGGGPERER